MFFIRKIKKDIRIELTVKQEYMAIRAIVAVFRVALGRDPEPEAISYYLPVIVDAGTGEVTSASRLALAEEICGSAEYKRQQQLQGRNPEWVAFQASLPEYIEKIDVFRILYPNGAEPDDDRAYAVWSFLKAEKQTNAVPITIKNDLSFDLYMRVRAADLDGARSTVASLRQPHFPHWALHVEADSETFACLAGEDQSGNGELVSFEENTPLSGGAPWLIWLKAGDQLAPEALTLIAETLGRNPETVLLFTDEDRIDAQGNRVSARLKAGWSDDQLLFGDTIAGLIVFSRRRVEEILCEQKDGSFFDSVAHYRLKLSAVEGSSAQQIRHCPGVLLHRPIEQGKADLPLNTVAKIVNEHLIRHRPTLKIVESLLHPAKLRVLYPLPENLPRVSIIIPTRDRPDLLKTCLDGVLTQTHYPAIEILVVDNGSVSTAMLSLLSEYEQHSDITVLRDEGSFNWARLNNVAVRKSKGDVLLLLNDDIAIRHPDWLEEMIRQIHRPDVGIVGARLLYPDDTIQHAGVVMSRDGARHLLRGMPADAEGYLGILSMQREFLAVTGACLLVRREVFEQVGGLDESFAVSCNDIDLCLRAVSCGWKVVWTPHATLTHLDGGTRGRDILPEQVMTHWRETARLVGRWHDLIADDAVINPALRVTERRIVLRDNGYG
ncbi:glycosyltransferase family 2 protein [Acetobacter sp.]|uniref:glycosyltransferase family 2 protein n=1 Tax=Acetobacter sp. TaxID=440 RepID=UPI0039E81D87